MIDFSVKFLLDRVTPSLTIQLSDDSDLSGGIAGNFTVTYPDGSSVTNTNFLSPDISAIGATKSVTAKTGTDGLVQRGTYAIEYKVLDTDNDIFYEDSKEFYLDFIEPSLAITDESDEGAQTVRFTVRSDLDEAGFSRTVNTFLITCDFPADSPASGEGLMKTLSDADRTINQNDDSSYYDGLYEPSVSYQALYQSVAYDYLSVLYTKEASASFTLQFEDSNNTGRMRLLSVYRGGLQYDRAAALLANQFINEERALDFGTDLLSEYHSIVGAPINWTS